MTNHPYRPEPALGASRRPALPTALNSRLFLGWGPRV